MLSHNINLHDLRVKLHKHNAKYTFNDSFVLVKECPDLSHESGCVFFTNSGVAVLWGNSNNSLASYRPLVQESDETNTPFDEFSESLDVIETSGGTLVHDGTISLTTSDDREYDQIAISFAMNNAVKLNYLEMDITKALELKNNAINELVNVVKSQNLDRVARTLFDLETRAHNCRYRLNLQQDLLEYPDVLWDYDKQCDLFNRVQNAFDIPKRLDNLNHRISWTIQTLNSYSEYVRHKHSSRLEKIIIAVISVELALALIQALRSNMKREH
ncbi:hypothetical protein MACK_003976 [Theileria orientalis]|uniref:DUF155 domain-containing protein n=1 Tax=Theileria orientalis TaxID=68886 RepID=A0A976SJQ1_THEOR|nr:hypothetical protein MACK_003976 [Theileria orientalis]